MQRKPERQIEGEKKKERERKRVRAPQRTVYDAARLEHSNVPLAFFFSI